VTTAFGTKREDARTIDVGNVRWLVYEHVPALDRRSKPTLVFESDDVMRRVRDFPADWRLLDDVQLLALSWTT
jgi:hypothetical protein